MIINLTKGFAPLGESRIQVERFEFPSGIEPHIKINVESNLLEVIFTIRINNMNDLLTLFLATNIVKQKGYKNIQVFISYLPFARQDRVMVDGEPLSIKVLAELINLQGYTKVRLFDVHSDTSLALINNSYHITNHKLIKYILESKKDYLICSPDAGAAKKIYNVCKYIGYKNDIIIGNKKRDVTNGNILGIKIDVEGIDINNKEIYIIDDICDGGRTFTSLAEVLLEKGASKVNLIISHGIFSAGLKVFNNINHIYTTDSFREISSMTEFGMHNEKYLDKLTQIKLKDIL